MEDGWMRTLKSVSIPSRTNKDPAQTPLQGLFKIHRAQGWGQDPIKPHPAAFAVFMEQNGRKLPRTCSHHSSRHEGLLELGQALCTACTFPRWEHWGCFPVTWGAGTTHSSRRTEDRRAIEAKWPLNKAAGTPPAAVLTEGGQRRRIIFITGAPLVWGRQERKENTHRRCWGWEPNTCRKTFWPYLQTAATTAPKPTHASEHIHTSLKTPRASHTACQRSYLTSHKNFLGLFSGTKASTSSCKTQKPPQCL